MIKNEGSRGGREVTLTCRVYSAGFIELWNRGSTLSFNPPPPPLHATRGEVCNVFDLMHSRNKVYCRVARVPSWIHFSASELERRLVFACLPRAHASPLCAHWKTVCGLGLVKASLSFSPTIHPSIRHASWKWEARFSDLQRSRRLPVTLTTVATRLPCSNPVAESLLRSFARLFTVYRRPRLVAASNDHGMEWMRVIRWTVEEL